MPFCTETARNWPVHVLQRMSGLIAKYDEAALRDLHSYKTTSGMPQSQVLGDILMHLFNHQTHHRGQAHACLSILTGSEPPSRDLLAFQRGGTAPDLEKLVVRCLPVRDRWKAEREKCGSGS